MAKSASAAGTGNQVIGKVLVIYGTVKAIAPDGTVRILGPNSPIFANDRIVTESDGSISIALDGPPATQIDIGRMSDILLDEDVYGAVTPTTTAEAATEAEKIQEALLEGEEPIELEATAAGGAGGAGGGHPIVIFGLTGSEVTPGSGAETTGFTTTSPDGVDGTFDETAPWQYSGMVTFIGTETINEDSGTITYTATVDNPPIGSDLVLTLDKTVDGNPLQIVIPAGQTTGSVDYTPPPDPDVYVDPDSITTDIIGAEGGSYTELYASGTATTDITDTIDTTTITLSAPAIMTEGGMITYTATLTSPAQGEVTVTLSNGSTITIADGETTGSVTVDAHPDTVYNDAEFIRTSITGAEGGNFENLTYNPAIIQTIVTDTPDTTAISLSAPATIAEGGQITYTATLSNAAEGAVTVTLSNDAVITIADGATSGSVTVAAPTDDVYIDAGEVSATIESADGGNFENLVVDPTPAVTAIPDTIDTTTLTLSAPGTVTEGGTITYTATLTNPAQGPVTVTLSNSSTITIADGATTGSVQVDAHPNTVYNDAEFIRTSIASAEGGNFETLSVSPAIVQTIVTDIPDTTYVSLSAGDVDEDAQGVTFTATLTNPGETAVTITTNLGDIVIPAGQTEGTLFVSTADPDVYVDPDSITATVSAVDGGNFEAVDFSEASATALIADTIDTTYVSLSAGDVDEDTQGVTFTATLTNPGETAVTITTNLGDIVIAAGQTEGTLFVSTADPDVYVDPDSITATVSAVDGGNFEAVDFSEASATALIADTIDTTYVSLSAGDVDEDTQGVTFTATLTNPGETAVTITTNLGDIVIPAGQTEGTLFVSTADPDVYVDPDSITATVSAVDGGNFEAVDFSEASATAQIADTIDTTTVTLGDVTVDEGTGSAVISATISALPTDGDLVLTLSNGATVTFSPNGPATVDSTAFVIQGDDPYWDGEQYTVSINQTPTSGGDEFEQLDLSDTAAVTIEDTIDTTTVSISGPTNVIEGDTSAEYTVTLSNPPESDVTVTLVYSGTADGEDFESVASVTIPYNPDDPQVSTTFTIDTFKNAPVENVESFTITILDENLSGGNFESLIADPQANSVTTTIVEPFDTSVSAEEPAMDTSATGDDLAASNVTGTSPEGEGETVKGDLNLQTGWSPYAQGTSKGSVKFFV